MENRLSAEKVKDFSLRVWDKFRDLIIAIGWFIGATLSTLLIFWFFTSGGGMARAGAFLLPFICVWKGFQSLIDFFRGLFSKNQF